MRGLHCYRPYERLRAPAEFQRVKREGRRANTVHFRVSYAPNNLAYHRLGFVVQKRFWNSVQRNQIKRSLREWFRLHKQQIIPPGKDIVIIARPGAEQLSSKDVAAELATIFLI